jgi:carboxylesterase
MKHRVRSVLRIAGGLFVICALGCVFYSCAAERLLEEEIRTADRDPGTGIIRGTEPKTLPGGGPRACLLVHGWIGSPIDFRDLGERLNEHDLTVRIMLLPGHGTSPRELAGMKADDFLRAVTEEFLALKETHEEVAVVGFSMGGALATLLAAEQDVDRLVLIAPYYAVTYRWFYVLPAEAWNSLLAPFVPFVIKSEKFQRVNRPEARGRIFTYRAASTASVAELVSLGDRARDPALLGRISCPLLLLHSEGDMAASASASAAAFESFGSGEKEYLSFTRSDHHILWDYDGEEAALRIVEFLRED